jgi:hypothetical protein
MRNRRDVGRITFGLVLAFSLIGLIWTLVPGARQQVILVPPPVSFKSHTLNIKEIQLDLPKTLRSGEVEFIRLQVQPAESEASAPVLAEARLELLTVESTPGEKIQTALSTVGPSRFEWEIRLVEEGELTGTLWLTFRVGEESQTVLAYPLAFQERRLSGLRLPTVKLVGWFGLMMGLGGLVWIFCGKK